MIEYALKSFIVALLMLASASALAEAITGTALYRERIALPPDAVFEATLEDVSRADAPAEIIGSARLEPAGQPPFKFSIDYNQERIEANHSYTVRGRITRQGRLMFTSDQAYPVLTGGNGDTVALQLRMIREVTVSPLPALPASFVGDLPCADCPGIRWQVDLMADGVFQVRQTYLDRPQREYADDIGRWRFDGNRRILRLVGGREAQLAFGLTDANTLRKLDLNGQPIQSTLNYNLKRQASFSPIEPELAFSGMYAYQADAGTIVLCATGQRLPVAMEGDNAKLEAAYSSARKQPGDPLLVSMEGRIAQRLPMEGPPRPTVLVDRFINIWPGKTCDPMNAPASLKNTYWKLIRLNGVAVTTNNARSEPHIVLHDQDSRVAGSDGCNRIMGNYRLDGAKLSVSKLASTMMACAEGMELASSFTTALEKTAGWKINGQQLELLDAADKELARFEAVALR